MENLKLLLLAFAFPILFYSPTHAQHSKSKADIQQPPKAVAADIKVNEEAKRKIDEWMEAHFTEWKGNRYLHVKRTVSETIEQAEKRGGQGVVERIAITFGYPETIFTELEGMAWRIDRESTRISELERKNGMKEDEWSGIVTLITRGKPAYSRTFVMCGWSDYRNGFVDSFSNPIRINVKKRAGEWTFDTGEYTYSNVPIGEISKALESPVLGNDGIRKCIFVNLPRLLPV